MRRNYYAYNDRGQKCFCKYKMSPAGFLYVDYFLPKYKFSIFWPLDNPLARVDSVRDTADNRKTVVTFRVHPAAWAGKNFEDHTFKSVQSVISEVFDKHININ